MAGTATSPVAFRTLVQGSVNTRGGGQPELLVVRDHAGWESLWTRLDGGSSSVPAAPEVHWASETVVALLLGMRPTTDYRVTIVRLEVDGGELVVHAREDKPRDAAGRMVTEPVHIVAVPAADLPDDVIPVQRLTNAT